jgi:hypothetical protein
MKASPIPWQGEILSVQPRIRLGRSFDERYHTYLGYVLLIRGTLHGEEEREFLVAVGKAAHAKHAFRVGMMISGKSHVVEDSNLEIAELFKTSGIRVESPGTSEGEIEHPVPPYLGLAPALETYRERGHRRLDSRTYTNKCSSCIWGCRMPVEMIIDHWNPSQKKYRQETFCYGPKSCSFYRAGPTRKVPGRRGMSWEEEDWVDQDATAHREDDE